MSKGQCLTFDRLDDALVFAEELLKCPGPISSLQFAAGYEVLRQSLRFGRSPTAADKWLYLPPMALPLNEDRGDLAQLRGTMRGSGLGGDEFFCLLQE